MLGISYIHDALIHPNGPKYLTELSIDGVLIFIRPVSHSSHTHVSEGADDLLEIGFGDEGAIFIRDALMHPDGPKHITELTLEGTSHAPSLVIHS